jgi:hypothetical protein
VGEFTLLAFFGGVVGLGGLASYDVVEAVDFLGRQGRGEGGGGVVGSRAEGA